MSITDVISLISSIASLVLAVVAIWLSIVFYKLSAAASESTTDAAKGIASSVERLEKLFDKLYSDTFSMMRETVTDMRKHIWRDPDANDEPAPLLGETLKEEIETRIKAALAAEGIANADRQEDISKQIESVVEKALQKQRKEATKVTADRLMNAVRATAPISVEDLARMLGTDVSDVAVQLFDLRKNGLVTWNGSDKALSSNNLIRVAEPKSD